jgi:hypothetical protein
VDIAVGDLIITDDEMRWRVHSITLDGTRRSLVALHLSSPSVLTADVSRLSWSETDGAWILMAPGPV